ncbi:hypothetical protein BH10BAC5_BH10BAC5_21010 [soil metagenome]
MKNGLVKFDLYLEQVKKLLEKAAVQADPAMWVFQNNLRTPFFMLEALTRIYGSMSSSKKLKKLRSKFKLVEDQIGKIDYYESLLKDLGKYPEIPLQLTDIIKKKSVQSSKELNRLLIEKWFRKRSLKKIYGKLCKVKWQKIKEEKKSVIKHYKRSVRDIVKKFSSSDFQEIEKDVHELRRELRWLSIYPQAMQGVFQYSDKSDETPELQKYLTLEIVNSPFNVLPSEGVSKYTIKVNKPNFLALSWMILELGKIKDEGLLISGLQEAIEQSNFPEKPYELLDLSPDIISTLLSRASTISKTYFTENSISGILN